MTCNHADRERRPYGPGGSMICFPCMKATPESEAAAANFGALLDAAEAISPIGVAAIGQESGPVPFDPSLPSGEPTPKAKTTEIRIPFDGPMGTEPTW